MRRLRLEGSDVGYADRCTICWREALTPGIITDVAHTTNQRAFRDCDVSVPFLRLYTLLVAVELALKDRAPAHGSGHDLQKLAHLAGIQMSPGLSAQLTALARSMGVLVCTSQQGTRTPVNSASYPGLRYLRHEADFPGDSKPADIGGALNAARQLIDELRLVGVQL